jgi:hypothetical protein
MTDGSSEGHLLPGNKERKVTFTYAGRLKVTVAVSHPGFSICDSAPLRFNLLTLIPLFRGVPRAERGAGCVKVTLGMKRPGSR